MIECTVKIQWMVSSFYPTFESLYILPFFCIHSTVILTQTTLSLTNIHFQIITNLDWLLSSPYQFILYCLEWVLYLKHICHIILPLHFVSQTTALRISCVLSHFAILLVTLLMLPLGTWNALATALCLSNRCLFLFKLKMRHQHFGSQVNFQHLAPSPEEMEPISCLFRYTQDFLIASTNRIQKWCCVAPEARS